MKFIKRKYRYKIGRKKATGLARIYIQNAIDLAAAKFMPNTFFSVTVMDKRITLKSVATGDRKVIRSKNNASIVELTNKEINTFCGDAEYVIVTLRRGKIVICLHTQDENRQRRESNFVRMLKQGVITTASLFSGIGALAYQLYKGFNNLGIRAQMQYANEIDPIAAEINVNFNPMWEYAGYNAVMVCDDIEKMDLTDLPIDVGFVEIAIPCVGHSTLTSKIKKDTRHPLAGKLFMRTIEAVRKMNAASLLIECTPGLKGSDTLDCVIDQLEKLGYSIETINLKGSDFGDFEHRKRFCLFAVSKGVRHLFPNLNGIESYFSNAEKKFGSIMDTVSPDDKSWKPYEHVKARNDMSNLGYKNVLINSETKNIPALLSTYASPKAGQPFVQHPTDPNLQRMISVREHARIRKLPSTMIEALCSLAKGTLLGRNRSGKTLAHSYMGNSVSPTPLQKVIEHMFSGFKMFDEFNLVA